MPKINNLHSLVKQNKGKKSSKEGFKSGIYNYCDRWCERCPDTNKCYVYVKEQETKAMHLKRGEDPNDPSIVLKDVVEDMKDLHKMLDTKMKELGITDKDMEKMEKEIKPEPNFEAHILVKKAAKYFKQTHKFLNEFHYEQQKMVVQFGVEIPDKDIDEELKVISWYHSMLSSKAFRLVSEVYHAKNEPNAEMKKMVKADLPKFFALVNKCITKSQNALNSFLQKRKSYSKKIIPLLKLLNQIKTEVDKLKK